MNRRHAQCKWQLPCVKNMQDLGKTWQNAGHDWAWGRISFGYATLGQIGFDWRFDYGAIGTTVILHRVFAAKPRTADSCESARVCAALDEQVKVEAVASCPSKGCVSSTCYNILSDGRLT